MITSYVSNVKCKLANIVRFPYNYIIVSRKYPDYVIYYFLLEFRSENRTNPYQTGCNWARDIAIPGLQPA